MLRREGEPMSDQILGKQIPLQSREAEVESTKCLWDLQPDDKAFEAVAGVREEVNKLSEKVVMLEGLVRRSNEVAERELSILTELLMVQLLKLDNIEADGQARVQRGIEVRRVQSIVDRLDNLKAISLGSFGSNDGFATEAGGRGARTAALHGSTRVTYDWEQFE